MFIPLIFLIFGLVVGSFLNVIYFRWPEFKSIAVGRSECPHCRKKIAWYDLIPVLSYITLFGHCRNCKKTISVQYPLVELFSGFLFFSLADSFGFHLILIPLLIFAALAILIFVFDLKTGEIPEILAWPLLVFAILASVLVPQFSLPSFLYGGLIGGGFLALLVGFSRERLMGAGDIKIGLAFGFLLGLSGSILFLALAFIIGALVGIFLIIFRKRKMSSEIPFTPFLITAGFIALFFGQQIVNFYLNFAMI